MQAVLAYAEHLSRDRRRSPHTVRAYVATAERLVEHLGAARVPTSAELRTYLADRRTDGIGNASAARELSAIRNFLTFVGGEGAAPKLKGPRVKKGVPRPISPDEVVALAEDVAEQSAEAWISARDWAVLMLLYGAGLRIGEAVGLTGAVLPLGAVLSVTGKRDKTRMVPLIAPVKAAVESYVELSPWPIVKDEP
ncbi:MAG: tyrosine recombinase XerC, partial [Sphingomonadales bacterium]|nr:tyrosine recombinase XerC [Sphingomonadales bacterium]